jgi:hypothetical protein
MDLNFPYSGGYHAQLFLMKSKERWYYLQKKTIIPYLKLYGKFFCFAVLLIVIAIVPTLFMLSWFLIWECPEGNIDMEGWKLYAGLLFCVSLMLE